MSEAKSFKCPDCGAPLTPSGDSKTIKCTFCSNTVIVPEELLDQDTDEELSPEEDLFSPQHVPWLIENGVDATVKVYSIQDMDNGVFLFFKGKKADGKEINSDAEVKLPRTALPRRVDTLNIKYNKDNDSDIIIQINGNWYGGCGQ